LIPNQSNVDFLIFKQAIDTGWDCPRASILVRFRETKSLPFEIQTIGRILRMPEAKHYGNEALNKGYIFTNLKSIDVKKEEYNPNIIKSLSSKRNDIYAPLKLKSYYKHRISYNDITLSFHDIFENVFCEYFNLEKGKYEFFINNKKKISEKIDIENLNNEDEIILNERIETSIIDELPHIEGKTYSAKLSEGDKEAFFERIFKDELGGFAQARSLDIMKSSFCKTFKKYMNIDLYDNGMVYLQSLAINNKDVISQLLNKAVEKYKPIKLKQDEEKANSQDNWIDDWEIPLTRNFNTNTHESFDCKQSLYTPCYLQDTRSNPEKAFEKFLEDKESHIKWWWKNGDEHMKENFGIKYLKDNKKTSTFQPDYIVLFDNNKLGIFDTKSAGFQEDDTKEKAEALQQYIKDENSKGKNLFGGIIIKEGDHLRINTKDEYNKYNIKPNDWQYLKDVI
ncbi:MAG: hypothetical protein KAJ75_07715, partial [Alphaproteobacteria bacterium]|nr:hypothetical protein [Alphaproteobacteria bacterium]